MRTAEGWLLGLVALAWALKVAVAAGAPPWLLSTALWLAVVVAIAGTAAGRLSSGWLDRWRLPLVLLGLLELPAVYGGLGGDGFEYYAFARSALLDGDLDFANDFAGLGARPVLSPQGEITSRVPIGQALVWLPPLALVHAGLSVASWLGADVHPDGFSPPYQTAVTTASFLLGFAGLLLIEAVLRRRYDAGLALLAALGLLYATPLHFYLVANPFMAHASSVAAASLFVVVWLRARDLDAPRSWLALGAVGALMSLIRAQNAVLLALPLLDRFVGRGRWRPAPLGSYLLPIVAAGLLQTAVWWSLYGSAFVRVVAEQNWVGESSPHVMGVLFSPRHGLFPWTPLSLLAVAGWGLLARRQPRLAAMCAIGFALVVLVNSLLTDWWGSDSFGQRRLLVLTPLFALGLGEALAFARRHPLVPVAAVLGALIVWNQQLAYIYNSDLVAGKNQGVTLDRLAPAQVEVAYRKLLGARRWLPAPLWVIAYDNLIGVWLDDGPWSMGGTIDIGREPTDLPGGVLGSGWFPAQSEDGLTWRQTKTRRSWLRVPIRRVSDLRVVVRAQAASLERLDGHLDGPIELSLEVNGEIVGQQPLRPEWTEHAFAVPARLVRAGFNDIALVYSTTPREVIPGFHGRNAAARIDWLRFERPGSS